MFLLLVKEASCGLGEVQLIKCLLVTRGSQAGIPNAIDKGGHNGSCK